MNAAAVESRLNILLVEDNAADARLVREWLADTHADTAVTHTPLLSDALAQLRRGGFHVVLLDLSLPDSEGLDTFLRTHEQAPQAPIVVLTGLADSSVAARAVREGAQDYLVKGECDGATLHRTLRHAVERHAALAALSDSEARFRQLVEAIREAFVMVDLPTFQVRYVSRSWETIWGQPVAEALGGPLAWLRVVHPADHDDYQHALTRVAAGRTADVTVRLTREDGSTAWIRSRLFPIVRAHATTRFVILAEDVTDMRVRERQLAQAQRMEAVGRLAGGVAHDFNNLLTVILGSASLLAEDLGRDHDGGPLLHEITTAARSAAALTSQLLAFSRQGVIQPTTLAINDVVRHADPLLRRLVGDNIAIAIALAPDLPAIHADAAQLEQVLINLAANARDAMPDGGRILVSTGQHVVTTEEANRTPGLKVGHYVVLSVTDSGTGMDAATQTRVFEPFFTTKELGKGTGLGLATVYGIVKQGDGWIGVESTPGMGTTFTVLLPAVGAPPPRPSSPAAAEAARHGGTETLLVVEDRVDTRSAVAEILRRRGYHVLEAGNADEAVEVANAHDGDIHLLLTDVVMPGANGRELATQLVAHRPTLRVLFMSGYPNDVIGRHGVLDAEVSFIQKPFLSDQLLRKIRELLHP
ncbi:MAG: response regulator [Vicinamibacterales bacterium]